MVRRFAVAVLLGLILAACGPRPPAVRPEAQGLRIRCSVAEAAVFVDNRFAGTAGDLGRRDLAILPGFHRIEVRAERHFPRYTEVDIPPGGHLAIDVTLRPRPETP